MADSFQNEVPKARINLRLNLHTGGAQKKVELPLKLLTVGDFSNGRENRPLSEREKKDINKNNFGSVLAEFSPQVNLAVENTLAGDGSEENILLTFRDIKDFEPEQVARQIPQLKAMLAMRSLLRDLKSNLLDNATFRKELERILRDPALSNELRSEIAALASERLSHGLPRHAGRADGAGNSGSRRRGLAGGCLTVPNRHLGATAGEPEPLPDHRTDG